MGAPWGQVCQGCPPCVPGPEGWPRGARWRSDGQRLVHLLLPGEGGRGGVWTRWLLQPLPFFPLYVVGGAGHDQVPFGGSLLNLGSSTVLEVPEVILICWPGLKTTAVDCLKESGA